MEEIFTGHGRRRRTKEGRFCKILRCVKTAATASASTTTTFNSFFLLPSCRTAPNHPQFRRKHHHPSKREAASDLRLVSPHNRRSDHATKAPPIRLIGRTHARRHRSMGSGKVSPVVDAAGASGLPQSPGSVCCMCGDRGLLPELFRCSACSVRSQHTYCTDRYPKAESYGTCNWCLRADGGGTSTSNSPRSAGKATGRLAAHGDTTGGGGGRSPKVAARGDFASSNLSKPIKKQQQLLQQRLVLRRSASDLGSRVRAADHNAPPSPGVARGRPRVRRYKLLEEVITS
ncbi:hypothetical protein EJB05_07769 [Eragrostis curvula]|uniref:PHD-type zinc finger plants domain-containing protein n=1 Tax=Eragrostis curvula TaxID=38414 RepID=A0A5J9WJ99_9POAL|nr:hypothetical protein EJB05_07769 [Eragrostis curvula]